MKKLIVFSLLVLAVFYLLYNTVLSQFYFSEFPIQFLLISSTTGVALWRLSKVDKTNIYRFTNAYILQTIVRLVLFAIYLFVSLSFSNVNKFVFAMTFFVLYLLFLSFEVFHLMKQNSK